MRRIRFVLVVLASGALVAVGSAPATAVHVSHVSVQGGSVSHG
jgi:hypothetical protein